MDPFNQVQEDGEEQVNGLRIFLRQLDFNNVSNDDKLEFKNQAAELQETIEDLKESIQQIKAEPELYADLTADEITRREEVIEQLIQDARDINNTWKKKVGSDATNNPFISYDEVNNNNIHTTVDQQQARIEDEERNVGMNNIQLQEELRDQDTQLDGVFNSVQRINQQARLMGDELEDHAQIIDEFEQDMDRTQGRLNKGAKRLGRILEKNRERFSDCCIMALAVVLIVLLVLIVIL